MPLCKDMKKGQIYLCEDCGIELQVVAECDECGSETGECVQETCTFECCGKELVLKK